MKQWCFPDDAQKVRWGLSSEQYVNKAVRNIECKLAKIDQWLTSRTSTPMSSEYWLDLSALLNDDHAHYYQNLIGILCWMIELGCVDIHVDVAMLARFLVQPHEGHLQQAFHISAYLKAHNKSMWYSMI